MIYNQYQQNYTSVWVVVVAQLAEWSFPIPEVRIQTLAKFYNKHRYLQFFLKNEKNHLLLTVERTKRKNKEAQNCPLKIY